MLLLLLLLLCFVCLCIFVYLCTKHNKQTKIHKQTKPITNSNVKGVCYFDIDDTLTTATGDIDSIIEECLKNNFDVGIITASNRTIDHICKEETAGGLELNSKNWMSNILCKKFKENSTMYNSTSMVAGNKHKPPDWPSDKVSSDPGYVKGFDMVRGRDLFHPHIPDKCVVLFDDQSFYMDGVKRYNKNLEVECANYTCGSRFLDKEMVRDKIFSMKKNGCV